jgi:PAS domain S-box-containing protein
MWGWDPTDDGVYADARCREICGLDPAADLTMDEVVSRVHPEDRPRIEAALAAALRPEGSGVYAEEFRFVRDGGSSIYVVARGQTRFEGKGRGRRPKRLLGTVLDVTEQREVDEALRESEERFRSIANLVPDLLWSSDPDGNSYWYNQRWLQYTGQNLGQAQGYGWLDAIHPEDRERSRSNFQSAVDAGEPLSQEHRIRGEDGRYRWFLVRTEPARDAKGRVTRWFGAATDIHDQRTAMEALQESEERYRTLFESMDEGFCVVEMIFDESGEPVDYRFERMNPAFERHTGLVGAQGKTAREMVPNLEAHWFETYGRVALTGEPAHFVDGSEAMGRWFDVYAFRPQGAMSRRVAILFNDVSERRQAEEALRESEQNYRTLVSNFPGAVYRCEWREEPTMVFVSDRIAEITGYPAEDFVENRVRSYGSLIHPEDRPLLDEQVLSALMRGEPYALEYRILHADGGVRWINERGSGFFSEEGVLLYLDGAIFDVTVREEARRALKESEERLRAVVDNAPIILVAFDRDGVYRLAEGRGHDALGVAPGGAVGRSAFEIFRDNRPVLEDTRRALAGEAFVAVRKINGALWETTYTPLRDEAGEPAGAIAVGTDVTDRKRAEEERDRLRAQEWVARAEAGERERISRELHDRVAHQMAVVHQSLELYGVLKTAAPERAETRLSLARDLAKASLDATRNLSAELRRSEAEDGLEAALRDLLDAIEAPGFATELAVRGDEGLIPPHIRGQVFMILREAVRNAARHSGGEGVSVAVEVTPEELVGSVEDGGMGMDGDGSGEGTVGLKSMRERTQLLGGRFHMETGPEGTKIVVRVPLNGRRKDG